MSLAYRAIQWSSYKRRYDLVIASGVIAYLLAFVAASKLARRGTSAISDEVLLIRALGTCGLLMLHIVLAIGPLCRLWPRFLPLLYNRRHFGVATFCVGAAHALLAIGYYHGFGVVGPLTSLLSGNTSYFSLVGFPFETPGIIGLLILLLMAATSHDFWLRNLTPRTWKMLHMLVYVAWALLVMHAALGVMQAERSLVWPIAIGSGTLAAIALHLLAGTREVRRDRSVTDAGAAEWIDVAAVDELREGRGATFCLRGRERIALFRQAETVYALGNVCAHQGGPLGEGWIIDGCITCPWHGYQYQPSDGRAPPPFKERVPTYSVRINQGRVLVNLRSGQRIEGVVAEDVHGSDHD